MAITVTHKFVSTIPDGDDTTVVRPSNWNDTHELNGLGTMAEQNANAVAITGGTISGVTIPASNLTGTVDVPHGGTGATTLTGYVKGAGTTALTASSTIPNTDIAGLGTASTKDAGVANGVATLDSAGKVPISQIPDAVIGALNYQGTWNATTNTPTLTSSVGTKGYYYVVSVAGTTNLNGVTDWQIGDWAVYNGTAWQKVDNTDGVTSVNGQTGAVSITLTGLGAGTIATQNANNVAITGGSINGTTIGATTAADITGNTVTAATAFVSENYKGLPGVGGNLKTNSGTSLLNWDGAGAGNVTINGGLNANPSNKNVSLAPTGTGTVTINPATFGTINNMAIGGTTAAAGSFTDLSVTGTASFDGSQGTAGQVLTSAGTGATPTWTTPTTGTVTSVAATVPSFLSVSGSPITTSGTLALTYSGTALPVANGGTGATTLAGANIAVKNVSNTFTDDQIISVTDANTALRITQLGTGNALLVEDSANPDSTPTVINANGDVIVGSLTGIGAAKLFVVSDTSLGYSGYSAGAAASPVRLYRSNGSSASPTIVASGDLLSLVQSYGYDGASYIEGTRIASQVDGTPGTNDMPGRLTFSTTADGASAVTERLRISSTGAFGLSGANYGTSGQVLTSAGSGAAPTWSTPTVSAAGSNTQVQYNNSGALGASSSFTYASSTLTAPNLVASNGLVMNNGTVGASFSIASGYNAMSVGPVTVATGQSVTVPSGSRWVVL